MLKAKPQPATAGGAGGEPWPQWPRSVLLSARQATTSHRPMTFWSLSTAGTSLLYRKSHLDWVLKGIDCRDNESRRERT